MGIKFEDHQARHASHGLPDMTQSANAWLPALTDAAVQKTSKNDQADAPGVAEPSDSFTFITAPAQLTGLAIPPGAEPPLAAISLVTDSSHLMNPTICEGRVKEAGCSDLLTGVTKGVVATALLSITSGFICCALEILNAPSLVAGEYNPLSEYFRLAATLREMLLLELGEAHQVLLFSAEEQRAALNSAIPSNGPHTKEWIVYRMLHGELPETVKPAMVMGAITALILWMSKRGKTDTTPVIFKN